EGEYAELVAVAAMTAALDVYARAIGDEPPGLLPPVEGPPARERPDGVGDVGAFISMTEEKVLANVTRALSLVPRTNATWRMLVTESYSRGPQMLELTWHRALTRPQTELIAAEISKLQECFY
ncbi:MAG TPA: alkylhydroperoxidase-related (seleno)protein, partial [Ilumatobacteraceae bacterium]